MKYTAALDASTFIWCKNDYNQNKNQYYSLVSVAPIVYGQIKKLKIPILFRNQLWDLIRREFPYDEINEIHPDYCENALRFLINTDWILYNEVEKSGFVSNPNIIKGHFNEETVNEMNYQLAQIHDNSVAYKFLSFQHFFRSKDNLEINHKHKITAEIDTLSYQTEKEIVDFFEKRKIKFRHNNKHDKYKSGGKISPLSCYNERKGDTTEAQNLLEKAHLLDEDYYCYDENNEVYVTFVSSNDGTYHGFDISDEKRNVPDVIKQIFNKNGRIF